MKFENLRREVVVCTILYKMVFFFPSEIKIKGCINFWVRPVWGGVFDFVYSLFVMPILIIILINVGY